ncbi:photosystem II S4 domain protein, partial [Synechococcus sp. B60.1]|uniref:photosystem II S4 domain protein n=2 Tax=Synechococcus TaxID=1129 RepID=UPI0039C1FE35
SALTTWLRPPGSWGSSLAWDKQNEALKRPNMLPRVDLLKGAEYRETLARILDLGEQALKTWQVVWSDFLSPPEVAEVQSRLHNLAELQVVAWGGYAQAERQRLALARSEVSLKVEGAEGIPLAAVQIQGNFLFDPATHRDFLGALLGAGIAREKVGDILVLGDTGAQAIVVPELVDYLSLNLTQVRSVPVKVSPIPLNQLKVQPPRVKSITSVEASLRLDAVASAGFGLSRSKMVEEIQRGEVRVNWKPITQASYTVGPQDWIAIRGRGRLQIEEVAETKKGRFRIQMKRYL